MMDDTPLIKGQASAEQMALIVAQYYGALIRENVPPECAAALAISYQECVFDLMSEMQTKAARAKD